jgi:hypothetical protein
MQRWKTAALLIALSGASCSSPWSARRAPIQPLFDATTGRLTQLAYDSNRNGIMDAWTDMDGARPLRSRADQNEDGRLDRWEYYDLEARVVKVGFSRKDDGTPDAWAFANGDGRLARVELSSFADESRIDRWEFYDGADVGLDPVLTRAEEDTNHDGQPDRWETYEARQLATVAWDLTGDGIADRRLTYRNSRLVLIESGPDAAGVFGTRVEVE